MASESHSKSRSSSPHFHHSKLMSVGRPNLMRAAATAPFLQTSVTPIEAQYSQSSTRATALLTRMFVAGSESRQVRGGSIGSLESSCSSPDENQSPSNCVANTERKDNQDINSTHSENYFSFPNFEDFEVFPQNLAE